MKLTTVLSIFLAIVIFESIIYEVVADDWHHLKKKLIALGIISGLTMKKKYVLPFPLPLPVPLVIKKVSPPIVLPPKKYPVLVPKPVPVYHLVPKFVPIHHHKKVVVLPKVRHEVRYHHHYYPKSGITYDHHQDQYQDQQSAYSWQLNDWQHHETDNFPMIQGYDHHEGHHHEMPLYQESAPMYSKSGLSQKGHYHQEFPEFQGFNDQSIKGYQGLNDQNLKGFQGLNDQSLKAFQGFYTMPSEQSSDGTSGGHQFEDHQSSDIDDYKASENFNHEFKMMQKGDLLMSASEQMATMGTKQQLPSSPNAKMNSKLPEGFQLSSDEIKSIIGDLKILNDDIKLLPGGRMTMPDMPIKSGLKKIQIGEIRLRPEELKSIMSGAGNGDMVFEKRTDKNI